MACGAEMRVVQVVPDETMMVPGYEHHTLQCTGCNDVERRLVFSRGKTPVDNVPAPPTTDATKFKRLPAAFKHIESNLHFDSAAFATDQIYLARDAVGPFLIWPALRRAGNTITHPLSCWIVMALTLCAWHVPALFDLALRSPDARDTSGVTTFEPGVSSTPRAAEVVSGGFEWSDAGVGAAATLGLIALCGGMLLLVSSRRRTGHLPRSIG